jgi:hypothetical protein
MKYIISFKNILLSFVLVAQVADIAAAAHKLSPKATLHYWNLFKEAVSQDNVPAVIDIIPDKFGPDQKITAYTPLTYFTNYTRITKKRLPAEHAYILRYLTIAQKYPEYASMFKYLEHDQPRELEKKVNQKNLIWNFEFAPDTSLMTLVQKQTSYPGPTLKQWRIIEEKIFWALAITAIKEGNLKEIKKLVPAYFAASELPEEVHGNRTSLAYKALWWYENKNQNAQHKAVADYLQEQARIEVEEEKFGSPGPLKGN